MSTKQFTVSDHCTGRAYPATLVKETKCYYTVAFNNGRFDDVLRFHKSTLYIEWQHLFLHVKGGV